MNARNRAGLIGISLALFGAQGLAESGPPSPMTNAPPILTPEAEEKAWAFAVSAFTYVVPESREYVQPTVMADRSWLHLEGRYNYESLNTGSAWLGYNFSAGDKLTLELTPMFGAVFGDVTGVAPGYRLALSWRKFELSSEGEFLVNTDRSSDSFFYTWSELAWAPVEWFRFGLAAQRTKLYHSEFEIQRGFLVGFSYKKLDFTTYVFDPDARRPTFVLGLGLRF